MDLNSLPLQVVKPCMKSKDRINYSDQVVTPDLASQWLSHWNTRNRRFKGDSSDLYATEMKHNAWSRGSRLMFYSDGVLCDGQNRLLAVVKSGVTCLFDVLVGATTEEGASIDTGSKRSIQDSLQIKGAPSWIANKNCVAIINNTHRLATNRNSKRISLRVVEKFALENEDWLRPFVELSIKQHKRKLVSSVYYAQLAAALRSGESLKEILDFHDCYYSGENYDPSKNSTTRLREYILEFQGTPWTLPCGYDAAKRTQRAIKAFIDRQSISKLYCPSEYIYQFPTVLD
jgi:hypothetical protein